MQGLGVEAEGWRGPQGSVNEGVRRSSPELGLHPLPRGELKESKEQQDVVTLHLGRSFGRWAFLEMQAWSLYVGMLLSLALLPATLLTPLLGH